MSSEQGLRSLGVRSGPPSPSLGTWTSHLNFSEPRFLHLFKKIYADVLNHFYYDDVGKNSFFQLVLLKEGGASLWSLRTFSGGSFRRSG